VLGTEIEWSKNLSFLTMALQSFNLTGNVTLTHSQIEMSETEYISRLENARDNEEVTNQRVMAGQAPYLINAGLSYKNIDNGFEGGIYYNVQGKTLQYVGIADKPDVYSKPFHSMNVNVNYRFGIEKQSSIGFKVDNLLGSNRVQVFESYGSEEQLFQLIQPFRTISVRYKTSF